MVLFDVPNVARKMDGKLKQYLWKNFFLTVLIVGKICQCCEIFLSVANLILKIVLHVATPFK